MFGENSGGYTGGFPENGVPPGNVGACWTWGYNYSGFGAPTVGLSRSLTADAYGNFGSEHPGGVNFCFADGSVRKIAPDVDFDAWVYLSGYKVDGVMVSLNP